MKHRCFLVFLLVLLLCSMTSCGQSHVHQWAAADCTHPQTCTLCGATQGTATGHQLSEATCTEAPTCSVCGAVVGEPLGHAWVEATCTTARYCSDCKITEGEPLGHQFTEANYQLPSYCEICGLIEGEVLTPDFVLYDLVCGAELDTSYPITTVLAEKPGTSVNGTASLSQTESSSDSMEEYETRTYELKIQFSSGNGSQGTPEILLAYGDYYSMNAVCAIFALPSMEGQEFPLQIASVTYAVSYYGTSCEQCFLSVTDYGTEILDISEAQDGSDTIAERVLTVEITVPKGYDGAVLALCKQQAVNESTRFCDLDHLESIIWSLSTAES